MSKRDRPAKNPGGVQCERCDAIFVGEEWHTLCGICIDVVAAAIAKDQGEFVKLDVPPT